MPGSFVRPSPARTFFLSSSIVGRAVLEHRSIGLAKIVPHPTPRRPDRNRSFVQPPLPQPAPAAVAAAGGQLRFSDRRTPLALPFQQRPQRVAHQLPSFQRRLHEKVARIDVAVVLHHHIVAAALAERAAGGLMPHVIARIESNSRTGRRRAGLAEVALPEIRRSRTEPADNRPAEGLNSAQAPVARVETSTPG